MLGQIQMKKRVLKEQAKTPKDGVIALYEHDGSYSIRVNGYDLMSTRKHASEDSLATLGCKPFSQKKGVRVLIGGLGFGFTLRTALAILGDDAEIVVAEIIPEVVSWNRTYPLAGDSLADRRVQVVEKDVAEVIRDNPSQFDVILLDVDNGPFGLSVDSNEKLYHPAGLSQTKAALRPGGCLGIWSAQADPKFAARMEEAGFAVTSERVQSQTIFLGRVSATNATQPQGSTLLQPVQTARLLEEIHKSIPTRKPRQRRG